MCACSPPGLCWEEQAGLKDSLFPRVIIPEWRNRNVLKIPYWTFLTGARAFGHTVAPLFPHVRLRLPAHLLHPPLPPKNSL